MQLNQRQAIRSLLYHQGLLSSHRFGKGRNAVAKTISQLHYVQVDTISVVERAHHHVLRTRVPNYQPAHLDALQQERRVFEYWAHAAAYLPMEDYRFYRPVMEGFRRTRSLKQKLKDQVLARIRNDGPLSSADFEDPDGRKGNGWWDWKPAKQALEHLFLSGELMVSHRDGFRKVYDLAENVLPAALDTRLPTDRERGEFYIQRTLGALGIGNEHDIVYARQAVRRFEQMQIKPLVREVLKEMIEAGDVLEVDVEGHPHFALKGFKVPARLGKRQLHVLSPFDNLVINRERLSRLFEFDYLIECYVPEAKRKYGYFSLPLLLGDRLVGRMDAKLHRGTQHLQIHKLWMESEQLPCDEDIRLLAEGLADYARQLGCGTLSLDRTFPNSLKAPLSSRIHAELDG